MQERRTSRYWLNDSKNLTIVLLLVAVALLGSRLVGQQLGGMFAWTQDSGTQGEAVAVLDVVLDRAGLRYVDVLLDRPVGEDSVGEVLGTDAATVRPATGGTWRWEGASVLRFEPAAGFAVATRYEFALVADRILPPGRYLASGAEFAVVTDQFRVERVDTFQESTPEGDAVQLRGVVFFNYPVNPEALAAHMRLRDPLRGGDPVPLAFETYWPDTSITFRSDPLRKAPQARDLTLVIDASLTPAGGNVALGGALAETVALGSSEVLEVWDVLPEPGDPDTRLRLRFSSAVDAEAIARFVTVVPDVPFRASAQRNEVTLVGAFRPGSSVSLRLREGLVARDGALLGGAWEANLRIPDLEPSVDFEGQGMFLSSAGNRTLAVNAVNVDAGDLLVERVFRNNLFYLFDSHSWMVWDSDAYVGSEVSHALGDRIVERSLRFGGQRNRRERVPLDLGELVGGSDPGLYRLMLSRRGDYRARQRWVLVTDLGIVAKRGRDDFLVWVSSFASLAPVSGARVTLVSDQNQTLASGVTDGLGIWRARGLDRLTTESPFMVIVERGNDFSFLLLQGMQIDTTGLEVGGGSSTAAGYQAFLYGERDIYRPGEVARGMAVVRDAQLRPPPTMPLVLRHLDPTGLEVGRFRVNMAADGSAPFEVALPAYARTGNHALEMLVADEVVGRYAFQVEEFVPDRIAVRIAAPDGVRGPGDQLTFAVEGTYLFGPPAAGLSVESRVRLEASTFAPAGFGEYSFAHAERTFPGQDLFDRTGELDDQGRVQMQVELPTGLRVPSSLEAVITARVREEGGRGIAARRRIAVHPYPYYVGLRRANAGYAEPGSAERFDFVALDASGQARPAGALRAELHRDEWQTVLRRTPAGTFRYESTRDSRLIDSIDLPTGQSVGSFELTPPGFGAYRVVLSDPVAGPAAQVDLTATGAGFSPWAIGNPSRIELLLDRDEYRPGDTASVQVRAPFAGRLLLAIERDGIEEVQVHEMRGNTATLRLPVRESMRPNAYVTATLVRSAASLEPGGVGRAFGAVPISVDRTSNELALAIANPEEMRPRQPLQITVTTRPGATVTIAAVDEGILQLIAQRPPSPFDFFYRKLALTVGSFDTFAMLFPEVRFPSGAVGGDAAVGGMAQFVRTEGIRRVEPVSFWSGKLVADAAGVVSTAFDLPDFQGALRLMAVASDGRRFGAAASMVRVRDPLVLLPTVPRFLAPGDRAELPVGIRNDLGTAADVRLRLQADLPDGTTGAGEAMVRVENGTQSVQYLALDAGNSAGDARISFTAEGGGERAENVTGLPIRPDLPAVTTDITGAMQEATLRISAASGLMAGATRTVRIGRVPAVQLAGRLDLLLRYPYGCLEQVTSTAFPLLYMGGLAAELDPGLLADGGATPMVQEAIRRLVAYQTFSGGFTLWPGSADVQAWASIFATHFLVESRRAGFLVPDPLLDRALDFLRDEVRSRSEYGADELQRVAYALYVLARLGEPDVGTMDFLRERHAVAMTPEVRALLGGAYAATGNSAAVEEMVVGLRDVEAIERQTGGNFNSPVRNRALVLMALLDAAPADSRIAPLAQRLARDAGTVAPWNTQETAFTLLALGRLFGRQAQGGEFSGLVAVGGQQLATFSTGTSVFADLPADGELTVQLQPGFTPGAVYYTVRTRGIPTAAAWAPVQQGLEVRRVLLDRAGRPADTVRQGDLLVIRVQVRSTSGALENVVVQNLLPGGIEVENPRLSTTESLPWIGDADLQPDHVDLRDDRILLFTALPDELWHTAYALVRAVVPGNYRLPPLQAEAMYEPEIRAATGRGTLEVRRR